MLGEVTDLPAMAVDLAVMTGNVAQVFLTNEAWETALKAVRRSLRPYGHLVFEVRDPADKAWLGWTREKTFKSTNVYNVGPLEYWCEVTEVSDELVSFRWTLIFGADGQTLTSESTIRFRSREAIVESMRRTGFDVRDIRGAPDRPGKEFVFIAAPA